MRKHHGHTPRRTIAAIRAIVSSDQELMTTRFNVAERQVGTEPSADQVAEAARIDAALRAFRTLEFDHIAARIYARNEASVRGMGRPVRDFDALIASVAIHYGQVLVTRNPLHFASLSGLNPHPVA